jgi:hypothetical protein
MKSLVHRLRLIGLSCWLLAGCVVNDEKGSIADDAAVLLAEDAYAAQDALSEGDAGSGGEEDLYGGEYLYSEEDLDPVQIARAMANYEAEATCYGFSGSGSVCHVRCWNQRWYKVGCYHGCQPFVDWGQCGASGEALCARIGQAPARGYCWN